MRQIAVVLWAMLATGSALAAGSGQPITEEEFLEPILRADSHWVRSLGESPGARRADLALAHLYDPPDVSASREDLGSGGTEIEAGVSWRPPRPGRRQLDIERAAAELSAAESSFERSLLEFRLDLRRVYADWAASAGRAEILEAEASLLHELARRSEERGRSGEASGLEVRRIRLAELETRTRVAVARSELETALAEVGAWRPDLAPTALEFRPLLPELPPLPATQPPVPPAVAALEAELRAAQLAFDLAAKVAEMPEIRLGWKRVEAEGSGPSHDGPVIGLTWPMPSSAQGSARHLRAETRRDAVAARLDLLRERIQAELRSAERSYDHLRDAVAEAEAALADAEPVVVAARAAFRLGEGDLTTLLDAIRTATAAQLATLELKSRALDRQRDLERVRGQAFKPAKTQDLEGTDQP